MRLVPVALALALVITACSAGGGSVAGEDVVEETAPPVGAKGADGVGGSSPAAGTYVYTGTGMESLDVPQPVSRRQGPEMTATVEDEGDGCWVFKIRLTDDSWAEDTFCVGADGSVELPEARAFARWNLGFVGIENLATSKCDDLQILPPGAVVGDVWEATCVTTNTELKADVTLVRRFEYVGDETIVVGGVSTSTRRLREEGTFGGAQSGTYEYERWLAADTCLPVRTVHTKTVTTETSVGPVAYSEAGEYSLVSLQAERPPP